MAVFLEYGDKRHLKANDFVKAFGYVSYMQRQRSNFQYLRGTRGKLAQLRYSLSHKVQDKVEGTGMNIYSRRLIKINANHKGSLPLEIALQILN